MKRQAKFILMAILAGCGGENNLTDSSRPLPYNPTSQGSVIGSAEIHARDGFQSVGAVFEAGKAYRIIGTGQWSSGQFSRDLTSIMTSDAAGENGYTLKYDASQATHHILPANSFSETTVCEFQGAKAGEVFRQTINIDGVDRVFEYLVPTDNNGPCCSSPHDIVINASLGLPLNIIERNSCVNGPLNALICKIKGSAESLKDAKPFLVGRNYESTPYLAMKSGTLYCAANDLATGRANNFGSLLVRVEATNP